MEDSLVANRSQMQFIDFVAFPLWNGVTQSLFPEFRVFLENLSTNRDHYAKECGAPLLRSGDDGNGNKEDGGDIAAAAVTK